MNINLSSTTTSQVYLGTSDVIKLAEYEHTLQHSGTMLLYQCKLHYIVYVIHGGSEPTDKTKLYSECGAHAVSLWLVLITSRTNNMIYLVCTLKIHLMTISSRKPLLVMSEDLL